MLIGISPMNIIITIYWYPVSSEANGITIIYDEIKNTQTHRKCELWAAMMAGWLAGWSTAVESKNRQ